MQLYQPPTPSAAGHLALMKDASPYLFEAASDGIRLGIRRKMTVDYIRAAYILQLQGREEDANTLIGVVKREVPVACELRKGTLAVLERDVRLQRLHDAKGGRSFVNGNKAHQ